MKILIGIAVLSISLISQASNAASIPRLYSAHAVVFDADTQETLLEKNAKAAVPFASITKVLTAMVALDASPDLAEVLSVSDKDVDTLKHTSSRIAVGVTLSREDFLHLALMSSENRAASAISRQYPGGYQAFIAAMNEKAKQLGMINTRVEDSTGLSPHNRASAEDLVRLVLAAERYEPIKKFTTSSGYSLPVAARTLSYHNTNRLVGKPDWDIELSKTGYTREAGRCIVMKLTTAGRHLVIVLLDSPTSNTRLADILSIRRWVSGEPYQQARVARRQYVNAHGTRKSIRSVSYQHRKAKAKIRRV